MNPMEKLRTLQKKLYSLQYALAVMDFDAQTAAPSGSDEGRSEAMALLSDMKYQLLTDSALPELLQQAEAMELNVQQKAEVRELKRLYKETCCIPAEEYSQFTKLTAKAIGVWQKAREEDNFDLFAPYLEEIIAMRRKMAGYFDANKPAYDVWLDQYEPGLNMEQCDEFFAQLRQVISPLVAKIQALGAEPAPAYLDAEWPLEAQRELSLELAQLMQIDLDHCAIAESAHPFTTEFYKGDVRITTHYDQRDVTNNLFSIVHEGGHALYELHTADRLQYTCLASGASMGIHESQSRFYENYLARNLAFVEHLWPTLQRLFPVQLQGVEPESFHRAINRCEPGLIRIEADELTYSLHVMVRYEVEKQLMDGSLNVQELPAAWNKAMKDLLGVDVPSDKLGVLQDIHWAGGDFGYFPSYALGTAYAAQLFAKMKEEVPVESLLRKGDFAPINQWLEERIWKYGKEKLPGELLQDAFGEPFSSVYYTDYLKEKFSHLYRLN